MLTDTMLLVQLKSLLYWPRSLSLSLSLSDSCSVCDFRTSKSDASAHLRSHDNWRIQSTISLEMQSLCRRSRQIHMNKAQLELVTAICGNFKSGEFSRTEWDQLHRTLGFAKAFVRTLFSQHLCSLARLLVHPQVKRQASAAWTVWSRDCV